MVSIKLKYSKYFMYSIEKSSGPKPYFHLWESEKSTGDNLQRDNSSAGNLKESDA